MIRHNGIIIQPKLLTISTAAGSFRFDHRKRASIKWAITIHLLLGGGMTLEQIFDEVYASDPNGGPLFGYRAVNTIIWQCFPIYRKLKLSLKANRSGRTQSVYSLVPQVTPGAEVFEFRAFPQYKNQSPGRPRLKANSKEQSCPAQP